MSLAGYLMISIIAGAALSCSAALWTIAGTLRTIADALRRR